MAVRSFASPSAPLMQDILKDLYIKELKGYKPAPDVRICFVYHGQDESRIKDEVEPHRR
ncbi:hypothetical protein K457DRAFT_135952 [Linnemannia elongata AG-77]|uniref:Uncharacterized protein n=1 Tax=Linnemannia elongata AG-77 TaxID=1314771 RepID=A0A197K5T6_9FUNG|nr:hypothetical protein K457DRAFT_135952 [Linnemannia elongata AG-77]